MRGARGGILRSGPGGRALRRRRGSVRLARRSLEGAPRRGRRTGARLPAAVRPPACPTASRGPRRDLDRAERAARSGAALCRSGSAAGGRHAFGRAATPARTVIARHDVAPAGCSTRGGATVRRRPGARPGTEPARCHLALARCATRARAALRRRRGGARGHRASCRAATAATGRGAGHDGAPGGCAARAGAAVRDTEPRRGPRGEEGERARPDAGVRAARKRATDAGGRALHRPRRPASPPLTAPAVRVALRRARGRTGPLPRDPGAVLAHARAARAPRSDVPGTLRPRAGPARASGRSPAPPTATGWPPCRRASAVARGDRFRAGRASCRLRGGGWRRQQSKGTRSSGSTPT